MLNVFLLTLYLFVEGFLMSHCRLFVLLILRLTEVLNESKVTNNTLKEKHTVLTGKDMVLCVFHGSYISHDQ